MPKLASVATVDTASTIGNCFYAAQPLGGVAKPTTVVVQGSPLQLITNGHVGAPVAPVNTNVPPLPVCPAGTRTVSTPQTITNVLINGMLPIVLGDQVKLLGSSNRTLTGPEQYPRIIIGSTTI